MHGQISCQDCHEGIYDEELHPNPLDVNKTLSDFFDADQCLSCHDDVQDRLRDGEHGSKKIKDPTQYAYCLRCHDPHYQWPLSEEEDRRFDPKRPRHEQCGACHKDQTTLPPFYSEDRVCMDCHGIDDQEDPENQEKVARFCIHCHGNSATRAQEITGGFVPPIDEKEYESTPHASSPCTICHHRAAAYGHADQVLGDCKSCHFRHDEKVARDAHIGVSCESCHLSGIRPIRDPESRVVLWERGFQSGKTSTIHHMLRGEGDSNCRRCHFRGNQIGAASMLLPNKSILCMPCHAATFSVGDTTSVLSLIVFLLGLTMGLSYWFSGSLSGKTPSNPVVKLFKLLWSALKALLSWRLFAITEALLLDVLLQRRLYRLSRTRWIIHSLIFFPFVIRFSWGLVALLSSLWRPEWEGVWEMLDKNHPVTALLFDLTGIMVILGVLFALIRRYTAKPGRLSEMPRQDYLALCLIAGIVMVGFILEGMRMAMTGWPGHAKYALLGYGISKLFSGMRGLTELYGYVWYVHAILTGVFVAYLPFSHLRHIIMAPLVLAMNAAAKPGHP